MKPKVGVLALQGSFQEHAHMLRIAGAAPVLVRLPAELEGLDALVIPGGESTTMRKLMHRQEIHRKILEKATAGLPVYGTCAGMIALAQRIHGTDSPILPLMEITVERNGFGRQRESFEERLAIPALGAEPFRGVFIRAPKIRQVGESVKVLARLANGEVVAVEQGNLLASSFHPELTEDVRMHRHLLSKLA